MDQINGFAEILKGLFNVHISSNIICLFDIVLYILPILTSLFAFYTDLLIYIPRRSI